MTKWQDITKHAAQTRTFSLLNWTKLFERCVTTQVESSPCVCAVSTGSDFSLNLLLFTLKVAYNVNDIIAQSLVPVFVSHLILLNTVYITFALSFLGICLVINSPPSGALCSASSCLCLRISPTAPHISSPPPCQQRVWFTVNYHLHYHFMCFAYWADWM